jgi:hypothetical protein
MLYRTAVTLLGFCAVAQGAAPAGLLSMVSGNVQIVRAGEKTPHPARIADLISAGDRVVTGRQSEASFVFCPQLRAGKMPAETEVQFDADALRVLKGKLSEERKLPSCLLPSNLALAGASQLQSGMLRLRGSDLVLVSPSRTNITSLRPHFRWEPLDNATVYDLKVMDREERILWRQSISSTEVPYPQNAPTITWGQKYSWRVTARNVEEVLADAGSYFTVLPKEQADGVRSAEDSLRRMIQENPSDSGPLFLLAFLYDENGMLDQAAWTYSELAQTIGPQQSIQSRLTELMNMLGWAKLESRSPH